MPLSARRALKGTVHARAVGLPIRFLSAALDAIPPTAVSILMMHLGLLRLDRLRPPVDRFAVDWLAQVLFETPGAFLQPMTTWMLAWSAWALIGYGGLRRTLGKWVLGLQVRRSDGAPADALRLLVRILASWLVPLTLGLAWAWIAVNSERRGWHDLISGTYVIKPAKPGPRSTPS